tara:strand:+ start:44680 stop:46071 length:1392 start_codon:yes stop_codon:yes gene_type:complete
MQDRPTLTPTQINEELLWPVFSFRKRHALAFIPPMILISGGVAAVTILIYQGLWVTGLQRPAFWGFFIVNFVFWIGVSHAGTMISAILRLTQAEWKRPITRAAEVMTIFSLVVSLLHPVIHAGRPWRIIYWLLPYDFSRGIWPDVRSPLVWDPIAITTYLTGSILFVFTALIPDFALIRDQSTGLRKKIYGRLALGWRGTPRQWKLQGIFGLLMSALILPVFVSVHSIVSWDFAVSVVPAWHVTVYAPYFVIGAVHSGVSMVLTLMALMRWIFKLENYIWEDHFDAVGRLLIVIATLWLFFFFLDFAYSFYTREEQELAVMERRLFEWPFNAITVIMVFTSYVIPIPLWLSRRVRRNIPLMFWTSILVNIGMWLERYFLIIPAIERKNELTFLWSNYVPSLIESLVVLASFGMVGFLLLLFAKVVPLVPAWEAKEGVIFREDVQFGEVTLPGIIKETEEENVW